MLHKNTENIVTGTHTHTHIYILSPSCKVIGIQKNNVIQDVMAIQNHPEPCQRNCLLTVNMWQT